MSKYLINDGKSNPLTKKIDYLISNAKKYIKISSFLMQDEYIKTKLTELSNPTFTLSRAFPLLSQGFRV